MKKYLHNGEDRFRKKVNDWATKIGVKPKSVQIRAMKNKWASCSMGGRITFSRDLLKKRSDFKIYVIVHELVHLEVPNHGKLFKSLMRAYVPKWERVKINLEYISCRT